MNNILNNSLASNNKLNEFSNSGSANQIDNSDGGGKVEYSGGWGEEKKQEPPKVVPSTNKSETLILIYF